MISRRTMAEMFIETLTEMLREERESQPLRRFSQMPARTRPNIHHLQIDRHEGLLAVDRFSNLQQASRSHDER